MKTFIYILLFLSIPLSAFGATLDSRTEATSPTANDLIYLLRSPYASGSDRKITVQNLLELDNLSDIGTLSLTGGQFLVADGVDYESVAMSGDCTLASTGEISCVGGSDTQIQFNSSGSFGGSANLVWTGTAFNVTGDIGVTGTVDGRDIATDGTKLDGIEALADVTDTANVTSAGALMDSEVDADIKTLVLPASTTISTFGATLVDDLSASAARTTLDVDQAGTDNSTAVTLNANVTDILSLSTQELNAVDAGASDALIGWDDSLTKTTYLSASDVRTAINVDVSGTDNSTNVTLAGEDYLTLSTQQITANAIDLDNLSATGTASSSTFLRGDNTWATPAGSGDVSKVGTPVDNQIGVWTGDGTIEGDSNFTWNGSTLAITGAMTISSTINGDSWAEFLDSEFRVQDQADTTKQVAFEVSGVTTSTTRTLTVPDSNGTIALTTDIVSEAGFGITLDGGGSAITTGVKGYVEIPYACTIQKATTLCDQTGSIVIDVWKDTYANYPPTDADSITASAPPTISSATKAQDSTLTGWTTSVSADDIIGFNVDSITTVTRCHLNIECQK